MREFHKGDASSGASGPAHAAGEGLLASIRQVVLTLLETVQVRLELLGTELEAEKRRVLDGLVLAAMALVCFALGLVLLCATIVLLVNDAHRWAAAAALSFLVLCAGLGLLTLARRRVRSPQGMFQASIQELARDRGQP